jgi:hypothetical protein
MTRKKYTAFYTTKESTNVSTLQLPKGPKVRTGKTETAKYMVFGLHLQFAEYGQVQVPDDGSLYK